MTRKRFIKLLMSKGIPKLEAQDIAARYNSFDVPYEKAYSYFMLNRSVKISFNNVVKGFLNLAATARKTVYALEQLKAAAKSAKDENGGGNN